MTRVLSVIFLASCLVATAFSQRPATRLSSTQSQVKTTLRQHSAFQNKQNAFSTALKSVEGQEEGNVVAAAVEVPKKTLMDRVWNDQTKLSVYLAVWYLGNIYYNIYNKKACIALGKNAAGGSNLHWALSAAQVSFIYIYIMIK